MINEFSEDEPLESAQQPLTEPLTKRELEVLGLLEQGDTYAEITDKLMVSDNTVKRHTYNIRQKLNAKNNTDAINIARKLQII